MISKVFSIYDSKLEAYMQPFYYTAKGQATRAFTDLVNDSSTMVGKHPQDYVLFEVGTWDDSCAKFVSLSAPISLGCAIEYVNKS